MGSPILIPGTGQCGFAPVMRFLHAHAHAHADCRIAWKVKPTLGWQEDRVDERLKARLGWVRRECEAEHRGDVSPACLPYVREILRLDPGVWILCLERPREEVAGKLAAYLDRLIHADSVLVVNDLHFQEDRELCDELERRLGWNVVQSGAGRHGFAILCSRENLPGLTAIDELRPV